jgi:hypothetical protein
MTTYNLCTLYHDYLNEIGHFGDATQDDMVVIHRTLDRMQEIDPMLAQDASLVMTRERLSDFSLEEEEKLKGFLDQLAETDPSQAMKAAIVVSKHAAIDWAANNIVFKADTIPDNDVETLAHATAAAAASVMEFLEGFEPDRGSDNILRGLAPMIARLSRSQGMQEETQQFADELCRQYISMYRERPDAIEAIVPYTQAAQVQPFATQAKL